MRASPMYSYLISAFRAFAVLVVLTHASHLAHAGPALLFDADDGKVLYAEDADKRWHPASLTKIMTAYLAFQELRSGRMTLASKVKCSKAAHEEQPSKIGLPIGSKMSMDLALQSLIVKSANDVAVMIAEAIDGTVPKFVARMNATAEKIGMTQTNFVNPNGLPAAQQVTSARDMAILARKVAHEYPEYAHYWKQRSFRIGKQRLTSYNSLLGNFKGADGMKTGFICDSGFNVVASATRDGRRLMAVVLGEPSSRSRSIRAESLLEHGFHQYGWKQLFNTTNLKNMPLHEDHGAIESVRHTIESWSCNPPKRRVKSTKKKRSKKLRQRTADKK